MSDRHPSHLIPEPVRAYNIRLDSALRTYSPTVNLRKWKLARGLVVTVAVVAFATFAILRGAEPTTTALFALVLVALLNGIDLAELVSVWAEIRMHDSRDSDDEER
jgi:hypothetical protein